MQPDMFDVEHSICPNIHVTTSCKVHSGPIIFTDVALCSFPAHWFYYADSYVVVVPSTWGFMVFLGSYKVIHIVCTESSYYGTPKWQTSRKFSIVKLTVCNQKCSMWNIILQISYFLNFSWRHIYTMNTKETHFDFEETLLLKLLNYFSH